MILKVINNGMTSFIPEPISQTNVVRPICMFCVPVFQFPVLISIKKIIYTCNQFKRKRESEAQPPLHAKPGMKSKDSARSIKPNKQRTLE